MQVDTRDGNGVARAHDSVDTRVGSVDNLTPCQEVSLAGPAGRKKRRGRDGEAAAARQRIFPQHPPLNAPLTREQAQVEAKLWETYLVDAGPARREAGEYALDQIRERCYQTLEDWLAFYKGRLITENKLWAALTLAIDLNQDVRKLCQRESCKKSSMLEKTVRGLAFQVLKSAPRVDADPWHVEMREDR